MSTENTNGRVVVITGASSGIGEPTARALAADGHRVALLARRLDRIEALAHELGNGAVAIQADVTAKWGMNGWSESLRQRLQPCVRVIVIEPGAVATELTDHITHRETKAAAEQMCEATAIAPQDIAEIIAFAVSRPRSVSLNEILVRPAGQAL